MFYRTLIKSNIMFILSPALFNPILMVFYLPTRQEVTEQQLTWKDSIYKLHTIHNTLIHISDKG